MTGPNLRVVDVTSDQLPCLACCGILDPQHEGRVAKTDWVKRNLERGLHARVLQDGDGKQCGYIEYLPGEHAWRAVDARGYMLIHCVWIHVRRYQRQGNAKRLVRECIEDARRAGMAGVAAVARRGPWLAGAGLFRSCGFEVADAAAPDYELLAFRLRDDVSLPKFRSAPAGAAKKYARGLTIAYSHQCPYTVRFAHEIADCARTEYGLKPKLIRIRSAREAQASPTPYAVFSVFYNGQLLADHQISRTRFRNIMREVLRPKSLGASARPFRRIS